MRRVTCLLLIRRNNANTNLTLTYVTLLDYSLGSSQRLSENNCDHTSRFLTLSREISIDNVVFINTMEQKETKQGCFPRGLSRLSVRIRAPLRLLGTSLAITLGPRKPGLMMMLNTTCHEPIPFRQSREVLSSGVLPARTSEWFLALRSSIWQLFREADLS